MSEPSTTGVEAVASIPDRIEQAIERRMPSADAEVHGGELRQLVERYGPEAVRQAPGLIRYLAARYGVTVDG